MNFFRRKQNRTKRRRHIQKKGGPKRKLLSCQRMDSSYFDVQQRRSELQVPRYKGIPLSNFPPLKKNADLRMREIETFETRKDDVLLSGYAKSGTHWMFEVINMLLSGKPDLSEESSETRTLEMIPDIGVLDRLYSPRLIMTHLNYRFLPRGYLEDKSSKIVHIVRNPKDCAVSCYHHFSKSKMSSFLAPDWETLYQNFMSEDFMYGGWFNYVREWREAGRTNSSVLFLTYEKCKRDPETHIRKIADFLKINLDDMIITEIARKSNFEYMKEHKTDHSHLYSKDGNPLIYRKGQVGDWKNMFTVAQNENFDTIFKDKLRDSPLLEEIEFT